MPAAGENSEDLRTQNALEGIWLSRWYPTRARLEAYASLVSLER